MVLDDNRVLQGPTRNTSIVYRPRQQGMETNCRV